MNDLSFSLALIGLLVLVAIVASKIITTPKFMSNIKNNNFYAPNDGSNKTGSQQLPVLKN